MTEPVGRPAYQQVADDLRKRIVSAEFPVGSAIPSTAKLASAYSVSITVVRAAVAQLRNAGLLVGRPGKGVFVRATPDAVAERAATVDDLAQQVRDLRAELQRVQSAQRAQTAGAVAEVREQIGLVRNHLAALYAELGKPYPGSDAVVRRSSGEAGVGPPTVT